MSSKIQDAVEANAHLHPPRLESGQIRLLRVESPNRICSFELHSLLDAPAYIAISYTWHLSENVYPELESDPGFSPKGTPFNKSGNVHHDYVRANDSGDEEELAPLEIDGQHHLVSQNILDIVNRTNEIPSALEGSDMVTRLWIDSVCINQADVVERSTQVQIMGDIYHRAQDVAVWLGWDHRGEKEVVLQICEAIRDEYLRLADGSNDPNFRYPRIPNIFEPATAARIGLSSVTPEAWHAFARFWDRRWFNRTWVMQEVALSVGNERFFWDREEIDSDLLFTVSRFLLDAEVGIDPTKKPLRFRPRPPPREWLTLRRRTGETLAKVRALKILMNNGPEVRVLNDDFWRKCETLAGPNTVNGVQRTDCMQLWTHMLELFRAFDATDPRDHVYATLGIIKVTAIRRGLDPPNIIVDYTKDVAHVYADAVKHIMEAGNSVNILCLVQDPQTRNQERLPSWVPDFSAGYCIPILLQKMRRSIVMSNVQRLSRIQGSDYPCFEVQDNLKILRVKALQLDEIVEVGESQNELTNAGMWEKTAQILLSRPSFSSHSTNESRIESLWRTLVANTSFEGDVIAPHEMAADFKAFMTLSLVTNLAHDPHHLDKLPSLKILTDMEIQSKDAMNGTNPAVLTFDEAKAAAAEVDRRWAAIEAGEPHPQKVPTASGGARFAAAMEPAFYRRIILTRKGYLGVGPFSASPGDLIWLMPGAPLPTVLRKVKVEQNDFNNAIRDTYIILGETYLHGDPNFDSKSTEWQWINLE